MYTSTVVVFDLIGAGNKFSICIFRSYNTPVWFSESILLKFVWILLVPSYAVVKEGAFGLSMPVRRQLRIVNLLALLKRKRMYATSVLWYGSSSLTFIVDIFNNYIVYIHVFLYLIKFARHWHRRHHRNSCVKIVSLKSTSASFAGNWGLLMNLPVLRYELLKLSCYLNVSVSFWVSHYCFHSQYVVKGWPRK